MHPSTTSQRPRGTTHLALGAGQVLDHLLTRLMGRTPARLLPGTIGTGAGRTTPGSAGSSPISGPAGTELVEASECVESTLGAQLAWLGVDENDEDLWVSTWTTAVSGQIRLRHVMVVGWLHSGKSSTVVNLVLPGLRAGTEVVLLADANQDRPGEGLRRLEPHLTRVARFNRERWQQAIALAHRAMCSRLERGWSGPSPEDPIISLVIDDSAVLAEALPSSAHQQVVQIGRLGDRAGVRIIQMTTTALSTELVGGAAWRATARCVIGHGVEASSHSGLATQSTSDPVSLIGLRTGQAAVLIDGQVHARCARISVPSSSAIAQALKHTVAAWPQLDMDAVGQLWFQTQAWSDHSPDTDPGPPQPGPCGAQTASLLQAQGEGNWA